MAVVKIVPMPGMSVEGPQGPVGPQGATGAQGPAGAQGLVGPQGPAGVDALWNYRGEYDNGADYNVGDVVTFAGGTYYRILPPNAGYFPTDPTYWDPIALPGAQGEPGLPGSFNYKTGTVPATHYGVAGDLKNDIRYDDTHMYICVQDYTDGVAVIWKRINWASGNW